MTNKFRLSLFLLGLLSLSVNCLQAQAKWSKRVCQNFRFDGDNLQLNCKPQKIKGIKGIFIGVPTPLFSEHPPLIEQTFGFLNHRSLIILDAKPYSGILGVWNTTKHELGTELVVVDGAIRRVWHKGESGKIYTEDWPLYQPPVPVLPPVDSPPVVPPLPPRPPVDPIDPPVLRKPILYLYPEQAMTINVRLDLPGRILHSYPRYSETEGWQVQAQANGQLNYQGREYYALYWEAEADFSAYDLRQGFVVAGADTEAFLEEKLEYLGLNARERNEFMLYWLPKLEGAAYNFIHFAQAAYSQSNRLIINPPADTEIRLMMLYRPLNEALSIEPQNLKPGQRRGFTAVEWGGAELPQTEN